MRGVAKNVALLAASLAVTLWLADLVVARLPLLPPHRAALKAGVDYDARDRLDVVLDKRRQEPDWYPAVPANTYLENRLALGDRRVLPLGGVADAKVVSCNESGYFSTFTTDAFGFNNPPGAWQGASRARRLYFVGDSFTQGDCLMRGATYVDRVRAAHGEVINLGSGGNGPLLELAAIREYVPPDEVDTVFWMYYEGNDLADLERDKRDDLLTSYLDPRFSQHLRQRQAEVNRMVRDYVEARLEEHAARRPRVLPHLRHLVWMLRQRLGAPGETPGERPQYDVPLLEKVLARAQADVTARGGRLVLVYLPEFARFGAPRPSATARERERVLDAAARLGVPVIDLVPVVAGLSQPTAIFPFGIGGTHYNEEGARLVADAISAFLRGQKAEPVAIGPQQGTGK